jgi:hypothetical protein
MMMNRFFTNSVLDDKAGTGVSVAAFTTDAAGNFLGVQMGADGTPYFGYLAQEVTFEEFNVWKSRISSPDMVTYFPGRFPGFGVVNKEVYNTLQSEARAAMKNAQSVTNIQAKEWLINNDMEDRFEAFIISIGDTGKKQDIKRSKIMWNWYEKATTWKYDNNHLAHAFNGIKIDKDKFFAEASLL